MNQHTAERFLSFAAHLTSPALAHGAAARRGCISVRVVLDREGKPVGMGVEIQQVYNALTMLSLYSHYALSILFHISFLSHTMNMHPKSDWVGS